MLGEINASAVLAVKDMDAAKKFYEDTLGLKKTDMSDPSGTMYKAGDSMIFVYPSEFAGTNKATALAWGVGDKLDLVIDELKAKGVTFEHYDMPGMKVEGDVHVMGEMRAAWFKDPDGNILNLVNQM
jgi:predicted enzyme related to lactoylglutathione lyase